jgi:hypothetical protein
MKKILLSLSLVLAAFSANAQTETTLQDFNYTVTDQATFTAAVNDLYWYNGSNWSFVNNSNFIYSLGVAATATNSLGLAGFTVGEKAVISYVFNSTTGVGPTGTTPKDSINSSIGAKAVLDVAKSYKVKFDVSPRRAVTYDVLDVAMIQLDAQGAYIDGSYRPIGNKTFVTADYGKKTIEYAIPAGFTSGDWAIVFDHTVTALDPANQTAGGHTGGLILDKIRLVETVLSNDEFFSSKFSVSPNPANNVINITNADNMLVNAVTVTDLNGRTVKNVSFEGVANAQVNVADLASGMYILNVTSDKGTATKKFVKN